MKLSIKTILALPAVLAAVLGTSCRRESLGAGVMAGDAIRINVSFGKDDAKSGMDAVSLTDSTALFRLGGETVNLYSYVSDYQDIPSGADDSKGTITTSDDLNKLGGSFVFNAWLGSEKRTDVDKDNYHYINNVDASYGSKGWALGDGSVPYNWRRGVPTTFWSYAPKTLTAGTRTLNLPADKASDEAQAVTTFTYVCPSGDDAAARQEDLLFAYNKQTWGGDGQQGAADDLNITFSHALAAIRFDISDAIAKDVTVNRIYFKHAVFKGSCTLSGSGMNTMGIAWTCAAGDTTTFSQSFSPSDFTTPGLQEKTSGKIFFMIPQNITGDAGTGIRLCIDMTRNLGGSQHSLQVTLPESKWEAGKLYTYKISTTPDRIDVDVEDTLEQFVKKDLKIKNTGNATAYIRAAIIGVYAQKNPKTEEERNAVVCEWDPTDPTMGEFSPKLTENGWILGSDGFYYYPDPVEPGSETGTALFTEYRAYFLPPVGDSYLQLTIAVQAVPYEDEKEFVTKAWGAEIADQLNTR